MTSVTQLGYLGIDVSDLEGWERFATDTLGLQSNGRDADGSLFLKMDEYHHRFVLHAGGSDDLAYVGWEVKDEASLGALAEQLHSAGVEVAIGSADEVKARRVVGLIKFRDPSGIPSEAYYGPLVEFENPFHSPRPISGFETGTMGLGHIVVLVEDHEASLHFYRDVLGMRISDFIQLEMGPGMTANAAFFHCNPRHHSLAFIAMPHAPKRLNHFMLQLRALDDVGATMYLCQDRGVPIISSIGRHTNDHMVSFYLRTPSGFEVEYGWGARVIDDTTWEVVHHVAPSIWGHR